MRHIVLAVALLAPFVSAEVVIQQVLYDPLGTETGGEAVELINHGQDTVDLSGWTLATASSEKDVILPDGTVLAPGKSLLIADEGWDEKKDNPEWRSADIVQTMTLGNGASFVELKDGNRTVDVVGWGKEVERKEGTPAPLVLAGESLMRISSTGDNAEDFIASVADFHAGLLVPLDAEVALAVPLFEISESLKLRPDATLRIYNGGDEPIAVQVNLNELKYKSFSIPDDRVSIEGGRSFVVQPRSEYRAKVSINAPADAVPGRYVGSMRVVIG